ncbi:hypothetical protein PDE_09024 [Penicillium oxalicum 114-2]|uniref:Uncharacterized protein n=1 Tax=Penicillium oxalicum (strain 114-2 / CGMCC 5302) TaxID=933388 RepID=S8BG21_PENO1|nr:hypothetical protein PDE_09024 [Penicillium oxalicum 114-2]
MFSKDLFIQRRPSCETQITVLAYHSIAKKKRPVEAVPARPFDSQLSPPSL